MNWQGVPPLLKFSIKPYGLYSCKPIRFFPVFRFEAENDLFGWVKPHEVFRDAPTEIVGPFAIKYVDL